MGYFSTKERFRDYHTDLREIGALLSDKMTIISGDFYGIQKFIFEGLATRHAAKVLRAKSAFVQIFTEYLARYICHSLGMDAERILSIGAGKFEILADRGAVDLSSIQQEVDVYFIETFYGLSGVMLSQVSCTRSDFDDPDRYHDLRKRIIDAVEERKFHKFSLHRPDAPTTLELPAGITNQSLCKICTLRKVQSGQDACAVCDTFQKLGKKLAAKHIHELVSSDELGITFGNFTAEIRLTPQIKSYTLPDGESPADFKTLSEASCQGSETGLEALAILKADVDNMGLFLHNTPEVTGSFTAFDHFSRTMDRFFSDHIPALMRQSHPHTYTVFAGGDDLFVLGAWDEIVALAREIRNDFMF